MIIDSMPIFQKPVSRRLLLCRSPYNSRHKVIWIDFRIIMRLSLENISTIGTCRDIFYVDTIPTLSLPQRTFISFQLSAEPSFTLILTSLSSLGMCGYPPATIIQKQGFRMLWAVHPNANLCYNTHVGGKGEQNPNGLQG